MQLHPSRSWLATHLRYFFRHRRETLVGRVTSNAPPPFRMRFSRTVPLLAPRAVWLRPLSADKRPSLMTYEAIPQTRRTKRQARRWSVGLFIGAQYLARLRIDHVDLPASYRRRPHTFPRHRIYCPRINLAHDVRCSGRQRDGSLWSNRDPGQRFCIGGERVCSMRLSHFCSKRL